MTLLARVCFAFLLTGGTVLRAQATAGWPTYGGDAGGQRYTDASQIDRSNVTRLKVAWAYHTHELDSHNPNAKRSDFEATPVLLQDTLFFSTPFDRVIALNAFTGAERWSYDPGLAASLEAANYTSRGVAVWKGRAAGEGSCNDRVFLATLDARLIALDVDSGRPCRGFGHEGQVDLKAGTPTASTSPYRFFGNTSPPTVVGDVVVVGSAVGDNQRVDTEPGTVRGFDARNGRLLWTWDAIPRDPRQTVPTRAGNAWSVLSADLERGLIYVPTGSPAVDFFGGTRPGNNADANSLVALEAKTGRKVWSFQLVHHDLWDYDVACEPLLFQYKGVPAVAIASKVGVVFILNRLTGEPLLPVQELPVPASDVPGETASPTQPFTSLPSLTRQTLRPDEIVGHSPADTANCVRRLSRLRYDGIFTPPSLQGTLQFPGSLGGVNWGSMAYDPRTGVLYANTNGSAYEIRLLGNESSWSAFSRRLWEHRRIFFALLVVTCLSVLLSRRWSRAVTVAAILGLIGLTGGVLMLRRTFRHRAAPQASRQVFINSPDAEGEVSPNAGAPYRIMRKVLQDDKGMPCTLPPWGKTIAVNLNTGVLAWERPLGTMVEGQLTGQVGFGAPILTAGDVLFTGNSQQPYLRALDSATGAELWRGELPAPAESTPMSYETGGRQFVVVAAGGHGGLGTVLSDTLMAFAIESSAARP